MDPFFGVNIQQFFGGIVLAFFFVFGVLYCLFGTIDPKGTFGFKGLKVRIFYKRLIAMTGFFLSLAIFIEGICYLRLL